MTRTKEAVGTGFGCVPSKKDLRDYLLNKKVCQSTNLPESFKVEHSSIKNQGAVGSCVAHSVSEVLEQIKNNKTRYSTAWIYGYRPVGYYQGSGMMTSQAMKTIKNVGCVEYDKCPGNYEMPKAKEYVNSNLALLKEEAGKDKIISYARLKSVQEIKEAIFKTGKPVVVCIQVGNLKLDENNVALIPKDFDGGHATVCYGWNETGLLIQNSWGKNWGNKGCFILPYEYPVNEAWLITSDENVVIKPKLFWLVNLFKEIINFFKRLIHK